MVETWIMKRVKRKVQDTVTKEKKNIERRWKSLQRKNA